MDHGANGGAPDGLLGTFGHHAEILPELNIGEANPGKARHAMVRHPEDFGEQLENSGRIDDVIVTRSAWLRRAQIPRL